MTDAFAATFVGLQPIAGRKVYKLVFEIATEQATKAVEILGGLPDPANPVWAGIARMESPKSKPVKRERLTSERAAMLCGNPEFGRFLGNASGYPVGEYDTANVLRARLSISSRRELDTDPEARKRFEILENEFNAQTGRIAHVR